MPYRSQQDRRAAKRRYNASPQGKAARRRYYLEHRPQPEMQIDPRPLAQAVQHWRMQ